MWGAGLRRWVRASRVGLTVAVSACRATGEGAEDTDPLATADTAGVEETDVGPFCGDGHVDPGELCDDGDGVDGNACSDGCEPAPPSDVDALVDVEGEVTCGGTVWGEPDRIDAAWDGVTVQVSGVTLLERGDSDAPLGDAVVVFDAADGGSLTTSSWPTDGALVAELPACTSMSATVTHDGLWTSVRNFLTFSTGTDSLSLRSPDTAELELVAGLAATSLDLTKGVIGGHATDCDGTTMAGALVVVRGADGATPLDLSVVYLQSESAVPTSTGSDGSFVVVNVPPGPVWVEFWARRGGAVALRARAPLVVQPKVVNWVDLVWGQLDGTRFDAACALPPVPANARI